MVFLIAVCEHSKAATGRLEKPRSGSKTTKWSFPLVPVQQDSGVNWKASNRLFAQPQAHFPLLGEWCLAILVDVMGCQDKCDLSVWGCMSAMLDSGIT